METDDDFQEVPPPKKPKVNYDYTRRFQNEWVAKLVWTKFIQENDGQVHLVKCKVCSTFEKKKRF